MEKILLKTNDLSEKLLQQLSEVCPGCVIESRNAQGSLQRLLNLDLLQTELNIAVSPENERYQFTWPGKREALILANSLTTQTLRPVISESEKFEETHNLFIEGDNLEVLKLLTQSYLNKIKIIYIDPPYNRKNGCDLIYNDFFVQNKEEHLQKTGQLDEAGNRLVANTIANGRFHSDWLSMMYSRLKLARNLLTDDGVIFISIDDNEYSNLRKISEEIFGEDNDEPLIWEKVGDGDAGAGRMKAVERFRTDHEYIIAAYRNNKPTFKKKLEIPNFQNTYGNPDNDPRGPYKTGNMSKTEEKSLPGGKNYYTVTTPSGREITRQWHFDRAEFDRLNADGRIYWGKDGSGVPAIKIFLQEPRAIVNSSLIKGVGSATSAAKVQTKLFGHEGIFDNPKPVELIKYLIEIASDESDIILDFFAGSATTAHAVLQKNAEDAGQRKFILVQLSEACAQDSAAYKAGYKTIPEIAKHRIRLAAREINAASKLKGQEVHLDTGFRVFRQDSSNMKDVFYSPDQTDKNSLFSMVDNVKPERTAIDLLFQVLVDWGLELSLPVTELQICGLDVSFVDENALAACFASNGEISEAFCKELAARKPLRVIFRDSGFKDDSVKINAEQIFKLMSPHTEIKCL